MIVVPCIIWAAPDHPIPSVYDADTADEQEHGVMQLFRLIKALLLLNFDTAQMPVSPLRFQIKKPDAPIAVFFCERPR
jgi:polyketide synthase PksM